MTENSSIEFLHADSSNNEATSQKWFEESVEYLLKQMEDYGLPVSQKAFSLFNKKILAKARSKTNPEEVSLSQGLVLSSKESVKFQQWYIDLHNSMLDVWDDFVLSNSPVLDQYDLPKSPSYLISEDIKEPGFITMAIALDGLRRATNLSKKTSATNPYEAIKQAYGQELVSQANVLINFVKSGGGSEEARDYCLYDNYSPFSNSGMDNDEKDKVVEDYNQGAREFNQSHGKVTEVE